MCRTLQQAASVPVVYATAYYSLVVRGRLRHGETVLIHSGSGGVGQAALAIALSMQCKVFTTVGSYETPSWLLKLRDVWIFGAVFSHRLPYLWFVGSAEKRAYLMQRFPQLSEGSFANSRDTTFEQHILLNTQGKGQKPVPGKITLFPFL